MHTKTNRLNSPPLCSLSCPQGRRPLCPRRPHPLRRPRALRLHRHWLRGGAQEGAAGAHHAGAGPLDACHRCGDLALSLGFQRGPLSYFCSPFVIPSPPHADSLLLAPCLNAKNPLSAACTMRKLCASVFEPPELARYEPSLCLKNWCKAHVSAFQKSLSRICLSAYSLFGVGQPHPLLPLFSPFISMPAC